MDLSVRHLPDLSDAVGSSGIPDASFQIPTSSTTSTEFLLADDSTDFLNGINDTFATPAAIPGVHRKQPALTLEELTPKSKPSRLRFTPVRSSKKPMRSVIPSPLKYAVGQGLSTALEETLSPLKSNELSFALPRMGAEVNELLMEENSDFLKSRDVGMSMTEDLAPSTAIDALTLSQLSPSKVLQQSSPRSPASVPILQDLIEHSSPSEFSNTIQAWNAPNDGAQKALASAEGATVVLSDNDASPIEPGRSTDPHVPPLDKDEPGNAPSTPHQAKDKIEDSRSQETLRRPHTSQPVIQSKPKDKSKRTVTNGGVSKRRPARLTPPIANQGTSKTSTKPRVQTQPSHMRASNVAPVKGEANTDQLANINTVSNDATSTCPELCSSMSTSPSHDLKGQPITEQNIQIIGSLADKVSKVFPQNVPTSVENSGLQCNRSQSPDSSVHIPTLVAVPEDAPHHSDEQRPLGDDDLHSNFTITQPSGPAPEVRNDGTNSLDQGTKSSETTEESKFNDSTPIVASSPMRASHKRSASAEPSSVDEGQRKRARVVASSTIRTETSQKPAARPPAYNTRQRAAKALQTSRAKHGAPLSSRSTGGTKVSLRRSRGTTVKTSDPARSSQDSTIANTRSHFSRSDHQSKLIDNARQLTVSESDPSSDVNSLNVASTTAAGRSGDVHHVSLRANEGGLTATHGTLNSLSSSDSSLMQDARRTPHESSKPYASMSSHRPTRPNAFHFHSDARIEARKAEFEEQARNLQKRSLRLDSRVHPIPDFRASHAAQEAERAARRQQIVPVVPMPMEFHTDLRAQEREKFEAARRAREQEAERQAEERRRQQMLEEEREVKELRKRAIPKANPIPEWYANAPKRNKENKLGSSVAK